MISGDDIDAFADDMQTVREFVRKAEKGIPEDRWTAGEEGSKRLAKACKGMLYAVASYEAILNAIAEEQRQRGADAMDTFSDPCRK